MRPALTCGAAILLTALATPHARAQTPAGGPAPAPAPTYDIRIQRPFTAGQSFALSSTDTLRSSQRVDLPDSSSTKTSVFRRIILDADVRIDKVDDKGVETAVSVVIRKLTLQSATADQAIDQSNPKPVLDPGTQVALTYNAGVVGGAGGGQPSFSLQKPGATLTPDAQLALQQGLKRMSLTDAVYGTTAQQKIGGSWPLNKAALGGDKNSPQYVDPSLISGSVTLKARRTLAGIECLQVDGTMTTKDFQLAGITTKDATMTAAFSVNAPTDLNKPPVAWSVRSTTHFVTEDKPLGQGIVRKTVDSEITHEATWTPKP